MVTAAATLTADAIASTPRGDGNRYEVIAGELFLTASASRRHAKVMRRLGRWMDNHVEANGFGEVYINSVDVRLTPFDVVVPDSFFLASERAHLFDDQWVTGAPDLIVETLSPSTRGRDLNVKFQLYARTGVREYWVIDPERDSVTVYVLTATGSYEHVENEHGRIKSRVLPSLEILVADLFKGIV